MESPAERIERFRRLGERASRAAAPERERIALELASSFRGESNPLVREVLVRACGQCRNATAIRVLEEAGGDPDARVRMAACEAWGQIGGAEAIEQLATILGSDVDFDVRLAAARALGRTGDPAAVAALGPALEDRDPAMQWQAVRSLRELTGQDFGNDVPRWRQYVMRQSEDGGGGESVAGRGQRLR